MNKKQQREYIVIVGARPNFVKAAPFFKMAKQYPHLKFTLLHTGQHFDQNMSKIFFEQMEIPKPKINLDIKGEFHTEKIGKMFNNLKRILSRKRYSGVIVFGDINSTLAGAVAAAKNNQPLIHIESGLRSHDRRMPEEINRVIVDHLSDKLFITEPSAKLNLLKEGIPKSKIINVGNIMIESLEVFGHHIDESKILNNLGLKLKSYVVATIHRQENTDDKKVLEKLLVLLNSLNEITPIILPLHPGTRTKIKNYRYTNLIKKLHVIEPLGYFDFLNLVKHSRGVVTDSGGIQEETSHLGVPCVTLRDNTERPITIEKGTNMLMPINEIKGSSAKIIFSHINKNFKPSSIPYWDKHVTRRIFKYL